MPHFGHKLTRSPWGLTYLAWRHLTLCPLVVFSSRKWTVLHIEDIYIYIFIYGHIIYIMYIYNIYNIYIYLQYEENLKTWYQNIIKNHDMKGMNLISQNIQLEVFQNTIPIWTYSPGKQSEHRQSLSYLDDVHIVYGPINMCIQFEILYWMILNQSDQTLFEKMSLY